MHRRCITSVVCRQLSTHMLHVCACVGVARTHMASVAAHTQSLPPIGERSFATYCVRSWANIRSPKLGERIAQLEALPSGESHRRSACLLGEPPLSHPFVPEYVTTSPRPRSCSAMRNTSESDGRPAPLALVRSQGLRARVRARTYGASATCVCVDNRRHTASEYGSVSGIHSVCR